MLQVIAFASAGALFTWAIMALAADESGSTAPAAGSHGSALFKPPAQPRGAIAEEPVRYPPTVNLNVTLPVFVSNGERSGPEVITGTAVVPETIWSANPPRPLPSNADSDPAGTRNDQRGRITGSEPKYLPRTAEGPAVLDIVA